MQLTQPTNEVPEIILDYEREDPRRWVPISPGVAFYPYLFDVSHGAYHMVFRVEPGAVLARHYHTGQVIGCTLAGRWRYKERDWIHKPGSYLHEVPGDMHTFQVVGDVAAEIFIINHGGLILVDTEGTVVGLTDVTTRLALARKHYEENGFEPEVIERLVR